MGSERQWKRNLLLYSGSVRQESQSEQAEELFLNPAVFVETTCSMKVPDVAYSTWALEVPKGLPRGLGQAPCSRECRGACIHVQVVDLVLNFCQYELFCKRPQKWNTGIIQADFIHVKVKPSQSK